LMLPAFSTALLTMIIELDINKNVEENAEMYYEAAKKAKRKLKGLHEAIEKMQSELDKAKKGELKTKERIAMEKSARQKKSKEWYEKFRWFVSSEGFFCVGGRDATTNEIVVKKHMAKGDIVFHTEMAGSPFFIIKTEGNTPTGKTEDEVAIATASFSRAWKLGVAFAEVFKVMPEQVSKTAMSGEYIPKGGFMIYGKKEIMSVELRLAVGVDGQSRIVCGPKSAVGSHCKEFVTIMPGNLKSSDMAKAIQKKLGLQARLDDIIRRLPSGGCRFEAK